MLEEEIVQYIVHKYTKNVYAIFGMNKNRNRLHHLLQLQKFLSAYCIRTNLHWGSAAAQNAV